MGKETGIAWTKSTFNPWLGCTKVGPGCELCYAESEDARRKIGGRAHWGQGVPRHRTSAAYWKQPLKWNREAPKTEFAGRSGFWPVFGGSWCDPFDNEVPDEWRRDYWNLIRETPNLTWQIVTKRIGNAPKMLPADWGDGYSNVWLISSIVNQEEADRDILKLLKVRAVLHGVSYEPALGPIDFEPWLWPHVGAYGNVGEVLARARPCLDWIICGGESDARKTGKFHPFDLAWARSVIDQCRAAGVACFYKQGGTSNRCPHDSKGGHFECFPADLQVREFPHAI